LSNPARFVKPPGVGTSTTALLESGCDVSLGRQVEGCFDVSPLCALADVVDGVIGSVIAWAFGTMISLRMLREDQVSFVCGLAVSSFAFLEDVVKLICYYEYFLL
jgi:hypothetical protein